MLNTLAGTLCLLRLKSIRRYCRLWPPPLCRTVMRPKLLRPPVRGSGSRSDFSGSLRVISAKSATVRNRWVGVTGLSFLIAIPGASR
jgi:hypothetical protein